MGAPKQKWTSEEEEALKAGVVKHGAGKWRTILKDPEFGGVLSLRSNVDLKDKWRNMSVMANGWGSREKARLALKRTQQILKKDESTSAVSTVATAQGGDETFDANPLPVSGGLMHITVPKKSTSRLDILILEAITKLKEPCGSNKTAIALYIEDQYSAPPDFKRILSARLKGLIASGKLIKVKRKYRIAPSAASIGRRSSSSVILLEGMQRDSSRVVKDDIRVLTKSQIDAELSRMRTMTAEEAAAAAARAVAEAEAAIADAEEATREAEAAEADFEARQAFADAAMMTLKNQNASSLMVHG